MPGHRKLQVHQCLDVQTVEVKDAFAEIEQSKRSNNPDDSQHCGDCQHEPHVPGFGLVLVEDVVISDGQDSSIVEKRQHDDHHGGEGIEVEHQDGERHEEQHTQRLRDAVDGVAVHSLKDSSAFLDCVDDHRQAGGEQHNGCCRSRRICRAGDGDPAVGLLERGSVVDTIASHANDMAVFLQHVNNVKLMFGKDLRKAIRAFNSLGLLRGRILLQVAQ